MPYDSNLRATVSGGRVFDRRTGRLPVRLVAWVPAVKSVAPTVSQLIRSRLALTPVAGLAPVDARAQFDPLALGPGRCSEFFDPKVRVMPHPY
jgi:hypothetical protein